MWKSQMSIPKIVKHKIIKLHKRDGSIQYTSTLPKEFAEMLVKEGVDSLYIVFDRGLGAFPKIPGFTEKALTKFMQEHSSSKNSSLKLRIAPAADKRMDQKFAPEQKKDNR
jgi:hypothetical protein